MAASPFQVAIEAVRRPLAFAARDDFAHADRVANLEESVSTAARRAAGLAIPRDARDALRAVAGAFSRPVAGDARRRAVVRALARVDALDDPAWALAALSRSPEVLPGVGPKTASALARRGLSSVGDLLFHLPTRWDDRRSLVPIARLRPGMRATFVGTVRTSGFVHRRGRFPRIFEALVEDETGAVSLKWFRGGEAVAKAVAKGARLLVTGDVKRYRFSSELVHPEVERLGEGEEGSGLGRVVPDYPTPEGIRPQTVRRAVARSVAEYADLVAGNLPEAFAAERGLPGAAEALHQLHEPDPAADVEALRERRSAAHERLALEELFLLELGLLLRREGRRREPGIAVGCEGPRSAGALERLPFRLTKAQGRAWGEIRADLERPHPMNRLLQGDVGSGKTVLAWLAAVAVAESGHQSALMAPTELLAEQHLRTLQRFAGDPPLRVALLTSSVPRAEADARRRRLVAGEIDLVVGTHALLQQGVAFRSLAFAVVDEQHRFGVLQRQALATKSDGLHPHVLVMTATPIPRTLALTLYGDLDLSVLDELPPGRQVARALLLREDEAHQAFALLRRHVAQGQQAYVVYPLVEETEKTDLRAATESFERIRDSLPGHRVDLVHGRLDAAARAEAMARFERGETHVLVSTTVVEVGVDVPNATLMIVEHAERFGLAQLHQLRGRVGRGEKPGTCVLIARGTTADSEARLAAVLETTDGFAIADADLRIRGPGEFLGTRQHGQELPDLRVANLLRDARWIDAARRAAEEVLLRDPALRRERGLAAAVRARWGDRLALVEVG